MKLSCIFIVLLFSFVSLAKDQIIFSVEHELPMEETTAPTLKKNYYINIGQNDGIKNGALLNVYRVISLQNHYDKQSRVNYKIKIGQIKVIEANESASIAIASGFLTGNDSPIMEIKNFMIGDMVAVDI